MGATKHRTLAPGLGSWGACEQAVAGKLGASRVGVSGGIGELGQGNGELFRALGASRPGVKSRLRGEEGGQRGREMGWERGQALEAWVPCSGGKRSPEENEKPLKGLKQRRARVRWGEVSGSGGSFAGPLDFVELKPRCQGHPDTAWGCYCVTGGPLQAPGSSVGQ